MNDIKIGSNRSFGLVFFIVFFIISIYPILNNGDIRIWSLILSFVFLILGLLNSKILSPLNKIWFKFGIFLGKFISPIIMGLIFFVVVTPIGLLMRVLRKDLLNLKFNNHIVTKEYYVNDYGNQIIYFTKSIYFRIREILHKEKFPIDNKDLYPGDYLIDIAKNIIEQNPNFDFDNFDKISKELTKLSVQESIKLIKFNLNNLGISHDNFASETEIVLNNEVEQVVDKL